jgi:uncharacterized protein YdeI (YjbR/CyaY-like superfamily)
MAEAEKKTPGRMSTGSRGTQEYPWFFSSGAEFREWLEQHHGHAPEIWVGFYKAKSSERGIAYQEALDQGLCYGWIDAIRIPVDDERLKIRFVPRRPHSNWSALNIKRAQELIDQGLMLPAGLKAFEERDREKAAAYAKAKQGKLEEAEEQLFQANKRAWAFFQTQPPGYRRVVSTWVSSAKMEPTRTGRLQALIQASERGERLDPYKAAQHHRKN